MKVTCNISIATGDEAALLQRIDQIKEQLTRACATAQPTDDIDLSVTDTGFLMQFKRSLENATTD